MTELAVGPCGTQAGGEDQRHADGGRVPSSRRRDSILEPARCSTRQTAVFMSHLILGKQTHHAEFGSPRPKISAGRA